MRGSTICLVTHTPRRASARGTQRCNSRGLRRRVRGGGHRNASRSPRPAPSAPARPAARLPQVPQGVLGLGRGWRRAAAACGRGGSRAAVQAPHHPPPARPFFVILSPPALAAHCKPLGWRPPRAAQPRRGGGARTTRSPLLAPSRPRSRLRACCADGGRLAELQDQSARRGVARGVRYPAARAGGWRGDCPTPTAGAPNRQVCLVGTCALVPWGGGWAAGTGACQLGAVIGARDRRRPGAACWRAHQPVARATCAPPQCQRP